MPDLPREGRTAWGAFRDMHTTRFTSMGLMPISYTEIDAWQRVTGVELEPWEVDAIRALDHEYIAMQEQ